MIIIYENTDKTIAVIVPTIEALSFATIEQIAEKDVPFNLPYWIANESIIPDRDKRTEWKIDDTYGKAHGFGGKSNEFSNEILIHYIKI